MKKLIQLFGLGTIMMLMAACNKESDLPCRVCESCQGLASFYNGQEFCPDGFDNEDDFFSFFEIDFQLHYLGLSCIVVFNSSGKSLKSYFEAVEASYLTMKKDTHRDNENDIEENITAEKAL